MRPIVGSLPEAATIQITILFEDTLGHQRVKTNQQGIDNWPPIGSLGSHRAEVLEMMHESDVVVVLKLRRRATRKRIVRMR